VTDWGQGAGSVPGPGSAARYICGVVSGAGAASTECSASGRTGSTRTSKPRPCCGPPPAGRGSTVRRSLRHGARRNESELHGSGAASGAGSAPRSPSTRVGSGTRPVQGRSPETRRVDTRRSWPRRIAAHRDRSRREAPCSRVGPASRRAGALGRRRRPSTGGRPGRVVKERIAAGSREERAGGQAPDVPWSRWRGAGCGGASGAGGGWRIGGRPEAGAEDTEPSRGSSRVVEDRIVESSERSFEDRIARAKPRRGEPSPLCASGVSSAVRGRPEVGAIAAARPRGSRGPAGPGSAAGQLLVGARGCRAHRPDGVSGMRPSLVAGNRAGRSGGGCRPARRGRCALPAQGRRCVRSRPTRSRPRRWQGRQPERTRAG
jgi:hypothetical protein